jgi:Flp pilus assembly protein TadB
MTPWLVLAGVAAGIGLFLAVRELIPAPASLDAALTRLHPAAPDTAAAYGVAVPAAGRSRAGPGRPGALRRAAQWLSGSAPWLPIPRADLALLGQDRESWLASKVGCGLIGLVLLPVAAAVLAISGMHVPVTVPVVASLVLGAALFFAPDLVTRVNARERRADFRHALASYLDLVSLERGAGAGPTEALEAAAEIGGGWAFQRLQGALEQARRSGIPPWTALARLAAETGVSELADLADIAEVAGQEGARILQTLAARAESMRAEALAGDRAKAGSRGTTMVVPIALLGAGFLVLLIFPTIYRILGSG